MPTGEGQYIDVSMQEAVAATTEHVNTVYNYTGEPAVRCGFRHGGQFVATWRCKDGFVSITTNTQQAWDDLRDWMAREGMAGDLSSEKFNDRFILRGELSEHIEGLIQAWALTHTRQEITEWAKAATILGARQFVPTRFLTTNSFGKGDISSKAKPSIRGRIWSIPARLTTCPNPLGSYVIRRPRLASTTRRYTAAIWAYRWKNWTPFPLKELFRP
jgi:crotonobetainyl-CoA:carnitine CoA-transferase CaiB-like acyl-CoA transferase